MFKKGMFLFLILIIFLPDFLFAHDNKMIHPFTLTGKAMYLLCPEQNPTPEQEKYKELQEYFYEKVPPGYDQGNGNYDLSKIQKKGTLGTIKEDDPPRPMNHFYNPITNLGIVGCDSALVYGPTLWQKAIEKYSEGNKEEAYHYLGRAIHIIEDMTSPPHVHSDLHFTYDWWILQIGGHNTYEHWAKEVAEGSRAGDLPNGTAIEQPGTVSYEEFIKEVALKTNQAVRIEGVLNRNKENPVIGDLARVFPAISYLKYVPVDDPDPGCSWDYCG